MQMSATTDSGGRGDADSLIVVAVFDGQAAAEAAVQALRGRGFDDAHAELVSNSASPEALQRLGPGTGEAGDLEAMLVGLGVPAGQARFYDRAVREGGSLVAVAAGGQASAARDILQAHGGRDVESQGADLVRPPETADAGTGSAPADVSTRWEDVASRYEMLWGQHYGAEDGEWSDYEPIYRYTWQVANQPAYRGRAWDAVEPSLRQAWEAQAPGASWDRVAGPMQDVWQDVAEEAQTSAEGGAARRTARPLE